MIYYEMKYAKWKRDCYVLEHDPQTNWLKDVENYSEQNKQEFGIFIRVCFSFMAAKFWRAICQCYLIVNNILLHIEVFVRKE